MGKILNHYYEKYGEAIAKAARPDSAYVIRPELWIYYQYFEDNKLSPFDDSLPATLDKLYEEDAPMYHMVYCGLTMMGELCELNRIDKI